MFQTSGIYWPGCPLPVPWETGEERTTLLGCCGALSRGLIVTNPLPPPPLLVDPIPSPRGSIFPEKAESSIICILPFSRWLSEKPSREKGWHLHTAYIYEWITEAVILMCLSKNTRIQEYNPQGLKMHVCGMNSPKAFHLWFQKVLVCMCVLVQPRKFK